jgi:hypothetical protein
VLDERTPGSKTRNFLGTPVAGAQVAASQRALETLLSLFAHVVARLPSSSLRDIMTSGGGGVILHTLGMPASP